MTSSKRIENPKTELSKKSAITDYDIMNMARTTEKSLCNAYVAAMEDVGHDSLFTLYSDLLKDTSQQQRKLFDLQFQHGWYSFTQADEQAVKTLEQEFTEYKQQLK